MEIGKTLYVTDREQWRAWLTKHHQSETEIWLLYYKKASGRARIPYDHAVEEALCFGWIDGIAKPIDDERFAQRFTPRRSKSFWSPINKRRAEKLIREGRMTEAGLARFDPKVPARPAPARTKGPIPIAPFVKRAFKASPKAWEFFQTLAPSYQRNYLGWIMHAKQQETRERRLREAISLLEQHKKLGLK